MGLVDAIPQTIKEIGRARAQGRAASGAYGVALGDIGQMVSTIPAQIQAKKIQDQQMQIRQQQMEAGALELADKKRAAAADAALGNAFSTALNPDGSVNIPQLTQHLAGTPAASSIPKIVEQLNRMQESGINLQESGAKLATARNTADESDRDELGALAAAASAAPDADTQAGIILTGIASRVKRGRMTQEDATPIIAGMMADVDGQGPSQPDPEKVASTLKQLTQASKEQRTLAASDAQKEAAAESARALAAERTANTDAKALQTKLQNISSQLANTTTKEQYTRVYQGIPADVKAYFDSPDEWTKDSPARASDVLLTPEQREMKRSREATAADRQATLTETTQHHRDTIAARDRATAARLAREKEPSNIENVRAYEQFVNVWDRTYPKPAAGAVDANGDPLPKPPAPPSLEKWTVMTPAERQRVISEPGTRITDAEMTKRANAAKHAPATPKPAASAAVPPNVTAALQGLPRPKAGEISIHTLSDGSVWQVFPDGTIRPGTP